MKYKLKKQKEKKICIYIAENEENMKISLENPIYDISYNDAADFFKSGYSEKQNHAGLGLYKIKKYSESYPLDFEIEKLCKENSEWLRITIKIKNARIS